MTKERVREISMEIAGRMACFTRPDSLPDHRSYPIPTFEAVHGMFNAIIEIPDVYVRPSTVHVCNSIQYGNYVTNSRTPLRKSSLISKGAAHQIRATVLVDVCYKLYATIHWVPGAARGCDRRHEYQRRFEKNVKRGGFHHSPCLGLSEFGPSYLGPVRNDTHPNSSINLTVDDLFMTRWSLPVSNLARTSESRVELLKKNHYMKQPILWSVPVVAGIYDFPDFPLFYDEDGKVLQNPASHIRALKKVALCLER